MSGRVLWGALWRDKERTYLLNDENCLPVLFLTRAKARAYIARNYGFIRHRRDLRAAPHHWRMPIPVRVEINLNLARARVCSGNRSG